ncbi:MAG: hypothetical protein K6A41_03780 [Bacteroidales bacterium]|nr:hypothetical protein [Bacteroidales bacterium]
MKKQFLLILMLIGISFCAIAQPPSDDSPTYPSGATYTLSDGSTVTKTNETLSSSTQYYNVVQVSNGTLNLNNCTVTKTGDGSSGDNSSFYGNNSTIYAGSASSSGYSSTSSATNAVINITGGTITTSSQGANAVFATNGATINVDGITIVNNNSVSRGLHCTYGGTIIATDVDITTNSETSSTIATDRGSGTVTVTGGTATANGNNSAVLYSTGTITATNLTGTSAVGEIAVVEGDNSVIINSCSMTSGSSNRGLMMLQSGSGDAEGSNAYITVTGGTLTTTGSSTPLCEVPTLNNGTLTLTDVTLNVASGTLMYVDYNTQWSTYGGTGNLILQTTQSEWSYTGTVNADSYSNVTVTVGENVTWNGTMDNDNNASSSTVTVNSGGVWVLTADSYVDNLVNNGTIATNGHTLNYGSLSGSGDIVETVGITDHTKPSNSNNSNIYTLDGKLIGKTLPSGYRGAYIQNGKIYYQYR